MAVLTYAVVAGMANAAGRKLISGLLEKGWHVFFLTEDTQERITPQHERLSVITVDFTQTESLTAAKHQILRETPTIGLLASTIDYKPAGAERTITDGLAYDEIRKAYEINTLGALRIFTTFYDMLSQSAMKRICAVTSIDGCNNISTQTDNYGYAMSFAALAMQLSILFNRLRPEGYTFRLYAAGNDEEKNGDYIVDYFTRARSYEPSDPKHYDENRLVPRDATGRELPW